MTWYTYPLQLMSLYQLPTSYGFIHIKPIQYFKDQNHYGNVKRQIKVTPRP